MASALSIDLRVRVMRDVDAGVTVAVISRKYAVSPRTVYNWKKLRAEQGTLEPRDGKTGQKPKLLEHRDRILSVVEESSGITLDELRERLELPVCLSTVWLALKTWGIVLKKSDPCSRTEAA